MAVVTYSVQIDWDNNGSVAAGSPTSNEDVTTKVLGVRTPLSWSFGRDTARALSEVKPGEVTIELNNASKIYSPDNGAGALFGNLGPGKPVLIKAVHNAITYNLFWGYIDGFDLNPHEDTNSVTLVCQDALARFAEQNVTTTLYQSIQTGAAIAAVLDAAGWSGSKRDLDSGATTIRWFWADNESALSVVADLVKSEGPSAIAYIDASGNFVFRDRHHRFLDAPSLSSQVTFNSTDAAAEPHFAQPANYDIGFRDLVNSCVFSVEDRVEQPTQSVFSKEEKFRIAASGTATFTVETSDPFRAAIVPVLNVDYAVDTGSIASVTLSRTSGLSTVVTFTAGGATTVVDGFNLRANPVTSVQGYQVSSTDATSQSKYGLKSWTEEVPKWVGLNDAKAIADIIIGQRKDRLPVFEITVNNGNDTRKVQQLSRKISDMVTIVEANSGSNHTYYVERIEQNVGDVGKDHTISLGCERVRQQDDPTTVFILDSNVANHRLDSGKLAT